MIPEVGAQTRWMQYKVEIPFICTFTASYRIDLQNIQVTTVDSLYLLLGRKIYYLTLFMFRWFDSYISVDCGTQI